jgi:hypothetical protein
MLRHEVRFLRPGPGIAEIAVPTLARRLHAGIKR